MENDDRQEREFPNWYQNLFGIDVRSLAALRIGMACVILFDLIIYRWPYAGIFLSDEGLLTRSMAEEFVGLGYWSLYGFDGSVIGAKILLGINLAAAVGLLVGARTRSMTIACLVLAWSVQTRNPLLLSGGDVLLRMLLVWSVFLPLGAAWSVDSRWKPRPTKTQTSVATLAIMIQMAMMYFFAGLSKCNAFWLDGEAIEYAMQLEMYAKPFAAVMLTAPWLLGAMTIGVLVLELVAPLLLFVPWQNRRMRYGLLIIFWAMHVGIWLTLSIGIFAPIAMIGWFVFVPGSFWDRWWGRRDDWVEKSRADYPAVRFWASLICAIALLFCVVINVVHLQKDRPAWYQDWGSLLAKSTMLIQEFELWGEPPTVSPSFEYPATAGGRSVDLLAWYLNGQEDKPDSEYAYFRTQAWRRVHWELKNEGELRATVRKRLLDWLVVRWDSEHDEKAEDARFVYRERPIRLHGDQD